jgi:hypothetical protein
MIRKFDDLKLEGENLKEKWKWENGNGKMEIGNG